jgi:hypothetical protein
MSGAFADGDAPVAPIFDEEKSRRWDYGRLNSTKARCATAARFFSGANGWRT